VGDTTWTLKNNGFPSSSYILKIAAIESDVYAATQNNGLYRSSDYGETWFAIYNGLDTTKRISAIAINGPNIFVGSRTIPLSVLTSNGVYRSTNYGSSWQEANTGLTDTNISAIAANESKIFAGTESKGVFLSADNGATWHSFNEGLPTFNIYSLALNDSYVFAGIMGGIWRRPLSEAVVSVPPVINDLPSKFNLSQNYPNPFNPNTDISYRIGTAGFVSIKIYDVLGREIAVLVNEVKEAGYYYVKWNASAFGSGIYLCRMECGSFVSTRKMILTK
jgi:hypothetical protein